MKTIKTLVMFMGSIFIASAVYASPLVVERPITACVDPTTLSVSTSAWTQAPATSNCAGRTVVTVTNPAANSAVIAAYSENSTTASVAITVNPIEIAVGATLTIHLQDSDFLFLVSLHTSAENAHIQEFKQRP